jgi:hypothetical protein
VATTKVKGSGFVPVNKTLINFDYKDLTKLDELFKIQNSIEYKILDTAGQFKQHLLILTLTFNHLLCRLYLSCQ